MTRTECNARRHAKSYPVSKPSIQPAYRDKTRDSFELIIAPITGKTIGIDRPPAVLNCADDMFM